MASVVVAVLMACGAPAGPSIQVEDVWSRPAMAMQESSEASESGMGMAGTGAAFMLIRNEGSEPDRLMGGRTEVAEVVEIHETVLEDDIMKMQMLAEGLEVPARGEVQLEPGGYHVMLIGIKQDLNVGESYTLELQFEKSGTISVEPEVRQP
jgi:copper(I)-binding protein